MVFARQQSPLIGWNPSDNGPRTNKQQSRKHRLQSAVSHLRPANTCFQEGGCPIWPRILIIISDHLPVLGIRFSALGKEHSFFLYIVARKSKTNLPVLVPYKFGTETQFVASWIDINDFLQMIIDITRKVLQTDTAGHQLSGRWSASIEDGAQWEQ